MSRSHRNSTRRAVIQEVTDGVPIVRAALTHGVHNKTVLRWCKEAGVRSAWPIGVNMQTYGPDVRARALRMVRSGMGIGATSRAVGIPRTTILRWRRQAGLPVGEPIMQKRVAA